MSPRSSHPLWPLSEISKTVPSVTKPSSERLASAASTIDQCDHRAYITGVTNQHENGQQPFTRLDCIIYDPASGERFLPFVSFEIDEWSHTMLSYRFRLTRVGNEP